jgi:hypothetical protein
MYGEKDKELKLHAGEHRFKRYRSFSEAGISLSEFTLSDNERREVNMKIQQYRSKFTRLLIAKFRKPSLVRSEIGPIVNLDEALEGSTDCYRRSALKQKAPIRVGINLSRAASSANLVAMRGAAILSLIQLCRSRGQGVQTEVCYGNGLGLGSAELCHVRINLPAPSVGTLTSICCSRQGIHLVGDRCIQKMTQWAGGYQFHRLVHSPGFPVEYDFVLDRIDTSCERTEENRIMEQFKKFQLM